MNYKETKERGGKTALLPECCYHLIENTGEIIFIVVGEKNYRETGIKVENRYEALARVKEYNEYLGLSEERVKEIYLRWAKESYGYEPQMTLEENHS